MDKGHAFRKEGWEIFRYYQRRGIYNFLTMLYMLTLVLLEKKDKKMYMGLSTTDPLTGILNRRAFQIAVEEELRKKRQASSSLLM